MSSPASSRIRPLLLTLLLLGVLSPAGAWAKGSLAPFAGKGTGYLLLSQGGAFVTSGIVNPNVSARAKSATFRLKCTIGGVAASQTITLKNGRARVDHLLPGFAGFSSSASGTYKVVGGQVRATLPFSYSNVVGTLFLEIERTSFGTALRISSKLIFQDGSQPIVMTIFAT